MNIPEITTSVSSVRIVENNLLHWVYSKDAVVTLKEAEEEVARVGALVEEKALKSTRLLIDIRPLCSIDRAASKLFASDQVHDRYGVEALGLLMSMIGIGALFGSLVIAGLSKASHRGRVLLVTGMLSGLAILLAAATTSYTVAVFIMIVIGIGDSGRRTLSSSLILEQTNEEFRGRVMGVYMMNFGLMPAGALPLGFIAAMFDVRVAFAIAGGMLFVAMVGFATLTNRIRQL